MSINVEDLKSKILTRIDKALKDNPEYWGNVARPKQREPDP